jgi:hypothetical protein
MFKLIGIIALVILGCALLAWLSGQSRQRRALQGDAAAVAALRTQKLCWADKVPLGLAVLIGVFCFFVLASDPEHVTTKPTLVTDPAILKQLGNPNIPPLPPGYTLDPPPPGFVPIAPIAEPSRLEQVGVFMWRVTYMLILPLWAFLRFLDLLSGGPAQRRYMKRFIH